MANNLSVTIGANTADLEKNINKAKQTLQEYRAAAKQAKNAIESNVGATTKQVNAYDNVVNKLEKVTSGTLSCKQEQKVLTDAVKELKIQWNSLTDDQRISGWGQQVAGSLKAAESELESVKGKLAAVSDETKKTSEASDSYSESSLNLSGIMGKLGIAIGGAEAAQKLFTAAVQSGNDTTDLYQNTLSSLTGTFDQLMYSLVHFDFTAFNDGLATTISRFYQAADAADTLWNVMTSFSAVQADANEKMARAREILSDTNASQEERTKALALYREGVDDLQAGVNAATNSTMESINKTLSTGGKEVNLTLKTLGKLLEVQSTEHGENVRKMLKGDVEAARALVKAGFTVTAEEGYALQQLYVKLTDEELQDITNKYNQIKSMQSEVSRAGRMENRLTNRATPTVRTPRQTTTPKQKPKTLKDQISWNRSDVAKSLKTMKDYEDERTKIAEDAAKKEEEANKWLRDRNDKADELAAKRRLASYKHQFDEEQKLRDEQIKKQEEEEKGKQQLASATSALLQQSAQMVGQETAAGQALMAMSKMVIIAKEAEAIAKGVAEASSVPWPANIGAIASIVASITSIFASLPTFADGGIFNGASKIGDYNIARVNDGEMILNGNQQAKLFKMLNAPVIGQQQNTAIASTKVRGQDIYISLKTFLKENPSKKL